MTVPADFLAKATIEIDAPITKVWEALTTPAIIKKYMFGTDVASSWRKGDAITWSGVWQGSEYRDKGVILDIAPPNLLVYSHFSPLAGLADIPENYHTVTIELAPSGRQTRITLAQDKNPTEESRAHSQENWQAMLASLKAVLEGE
jgi:uncharacterized protein YndB with AHSA1/START domain